MKIQSNYLKILLIIERFKTFINFFVSREIYHRFLKMFGSMLLEFKTFLSEDLARITEDMNEKTILGLKIEQMEIWLSNYKAYFLDYFPQV